MRCATHLTRALPHDAALCSCAMIFTACRRQQWSNDESGYFCPEATEAFMFLPHDAQFSACRRHRGLYPLTTNVDGGFGLHTGCADPLAGVQEKVFARPFICDPRGLDADAFAITACRRQCSNSMAEKRWRVLDLARQLPLARGPLVPVDTGHDGRILSACRRHCLWGAFDTLCSSYMVGPDMGLVSLPCSAHWLPASVHSPPVGGNDGCCSMKGTILVPALECLFWCKINYLQASRISITQRSISSYPALCGGLSTMLGCFSFWTWLPCLRASA